MSRFTMSLALSLLVVASASASVSSLPTTAPGVGSRSRSTPRSLLEVRSDAQRHTKARRGGIASDFKALFHMAHASRKAQMQRQVERSLLATSNPATDQSQSVAAPRVQRSLLEGQTQEQQQQQQQQQLLQQTGQAGNARRSLLGGDRAREDGAGDLHAVFARAHEVREEHLRALREQLSGASAGAAPKRSLAVKHFPLRGAKLQQRVPAHGGRRALAALAQSRARTPEDFLEMVRAAHETRDKLHAKMAEKHRELLQSA